ncbi:hypothetical protein [Duganella sp. Root336D2]|uniref:hypothetical protein n=1 Tax=Duganella sp. Root336D2 TaxID=1736518 RepID=UPI0006F93375|nr:hypothetical protein [Duganella sp. Root336D2]KQV51338.1 hypothetical protein ASD07_10615 [Duganella sp. Root336D2]
MIAHAPTMTLAEGALGDHAAALMSSMKLLYAAAANATELLTQAGFAGMRGDTADDLRNAVAIHGHLVNEFNVKVRTAAGVLTFQTRAIDAASAADAAVARTGDTPCGITVTPVAPDRLALVAAHHTLRITKPLDAALDDPALGRALRSYAKKHPVRHTPSTDFKSLAANDRD